MQVQFSHRFTGKACTRMKDQDEGLIQHLFLPHQLAQGGVAGGWQVTAQSDCGSMRLWAGKAQYRHPGLAACAGQGIDRIQLYQPVEKDQLFIESKNSPFDLVCFSFEIRNSMASFVPIGFRIRRKTYIF